MLYHRPRIRNTAHTHTHTNAHAQINSSDKYKSAHFIPMAKIDTSSSLRLMDLTHTVIWLMPQFLVSVSLSVWLGSVKNWIDDTFDIVSLCKRIQTNEIRHLYHKNKTHTQILVVLWQWTTLKLSEYDDDDDLIRLNNKS